MFDEVFKQRVIDKLISLVKTPNFDKMYTVVLERSWTGGILIAYLNNKETFRIHPSCGGGYHYYDIIIPNEDEIETREYDIDDNKTLNISYEKAHRLYKLLGDIAEKREKKIAEEKKLQKEKQQQNRLLAEKHKQDKMLSSLDNLINASMGYSK